MVNHMKFYIDGAWVDPVVKKSTPVVNPATEEAMYEVALGSKADVDKAGRSEARVRDLFEEEPRGARRVVLKNHRGLQGAREGNRRRHFRRNGRTPADGGE